MKTKQGLTFLIATIASTIAGVGLITIPTLLASSGSISLVGCAIAMLFVSSIAACFSRIGALIPEGEGMGFVHLVSLSFPRWIGWVIELLSTAAIGISVGFMCSFVTIPSLISVIRIVYPVGFISNLAITVGIYIILILTISRKRLSQIVITQGLYLVFLFKTLLALVVLIAGVRYFNWSNITSNFNNTSLPSLVLLVSVTQQAVWAMCGFEIGLNLTNLAENPERDIPRAILWGTLGGGSIYFFVIFILLGTVDVSSIDMLSQTTLSVFLQILKTPKWIMNIGYLGSFITALMGLYAWTYALQTNIERLPENRFYKLNNFKNKNIVLAFITMAFLCFIELSRYLLNLSMIQTLVLSTKFMAIVYLSVCLSYWINCFKQKKWASLIIPTVACTFTVSLVILG
jgi:amino acid transporter